MIGYEVNFDGIVGPTHNYSGLSYGNVASLQNQMAASNPKTAALQGLEKMRFLHQLGLPQAVLPPHERPHIPTLRALGFDGSDETILAQASQKAPELLLACSSAAAMWTANVATTTPAVDSADSHTHFTPANLSNKFHRSIEADFTAKLFRVIFHNHIFFTVHDPLPQGSYFSDEGAANHTRFCGEYGGPGVHFFVYGRYSFKETPLLPKNFPARQVFEASQAIARRHKIFSDRVYYAQQNPRAIDAGVFHNDVASVGNKNIFLYHENAFVGTDSIVEALGKKVEDLCDVPFIKIKVPASSITLEDAVSTYLFNSQIISNPDGSAALICPAECQINPLVYSYLQNMAEDPANPIRDIHFLDVRESMRNGGGPACLRFRVQLNQAEMDALHTGIIFTERLYEKLKAWIHKHYRDKLLPKDLADPLLLNETREALDELSKILDLGSIYSFQK